MEWIGIGLVLRPSIAAMGRCQIGIMLERHADGAGSSLAGAPKVDSTLLPRGLW